MPYGYTYHCKQCGGTNVEGRLNCYVPINKEEWRLEDIDIDTEGEYIDYYCGDCTDHVDVEQREDEELPDGACPSCHGAGMDWPGCGECGERKFPALSDGPGDGTQYGDLT